MNGLRESIDVYQSSCWHCPGWFIHRKPKVERNGLRCPWCNSLNEYKWTDEEYRHYLNDRPKA